MSPESAIVSHLFFLFIPHALEYKEIGEDVFHDQQGGDGHDLVLVFEHVLLRVVKNVIEGILLQLFLVLVTHILQHHKRFTEQYVEEKTE